MRLVGPRAASAAPLLLAAAAAALVTTVSLTAFVLYAYLLPQAGVRQAVADAPPLERSVLLISGSGSSGEDFTARDRAARELFADDLAGVPLTVYGGGAGISQRLPDDLPGVDAGPEGAYALVGFLEGLEEHAELVTGAWPQAVDEDEPAQVALPREVAEDLGLSVGERVEIVDEVRDLDRPVVVTGVWEARNPSQAYWALLGGISTGTGQVWGPFVVHPDEYLARYQRLGTLEWVAVADPADLARAGMPQVAAAVADLQDRLQRQRDQPDSPLDDATRVRTGLDGLAERLTVATVVNRSGLVLPAALLGVIAAYGLVLVARLLAAHRRGENALLRARGASRRQLVRLAASEAVLALGPAALAGAPAGTWLVRVADANAGGRSLGLAADLAAYGWAGPPLAWLVAVAAAAGCAVALALPAAGRGRTWVAEQQERSRPRRAAVVQRAGVDVALVAVAVLAWWQLRQYGQAVTPRNLGGLGVDPLLVAAPVLAVLAATAVALRLLPLATRSGVRLAGRRDAFASLLGMWQADRRPHAGPVLLLVLAVATAVLAPTVAATWQQSQRDQAAHEVGADLRLEGHDPRLDPQVRQLADMPQVDGLAAVHRTFAALPDGSRMPVLAIDSDRAARVVHLRADLAPDGAGALFGVLHEGRPQLPGIPLPEGARRLTGTLTYDAPGEEVVTEAFLTETGPLEVELVIPPVESRVASIYLASADGVVSEVELARPESGRPMTFDLPLPPGTASVVGLEAGMRVPVDLGFFVDFRGDRPPVEVSWRWELAVVDGDGGRVPLEVPDTWSVRGPQPGGPTIEPTGGGVVRGVVDFHHAGAVVSFLVTEPLGSGELPALVTPAALSAMGAQVGDVADLPVGGVTARIAGTVAALPGTADGEGIAVDLAWLSLHRYLNLRTAPAANEWWVATADPAPVVARAEGLGLRVYDRRGETEQLLDDPLGTGVLLTLWAAAAGGALLAAFGLAVDARANAVGRRRELAVLHTLGTSPAGLARALVVEQSVLAGLGVVAGLAVGVGVAVAMGTSLVLTPAGRVPVPEPLLRLAPAQLSAPTLGLFVIAVVLGALVARRARREVAAGALRIGED